MFLLFPSDGPLREVREAEEKSGEGKFDGKDVWFVKQTVRLVSRLRDSQDQERRLIGRGQIGNACGSIGLLHALLNLPPSGPYALVSDSPLSKFRADTLALNRMYW